MKFFFPDSHDLVDPSFDFTTEKRSEHRVRHRDDLYAHEVFRTPPFDGVLVSKAIVDGIGGVTGKYTIAQRHRLLREGVRNFFRLDERKSSRSLETMGDCGAFSYVKETKPPFTVDDVIDFYEGCGFDYGVSVDHVILGFKPEYDEALPGIDPVPQDFRERQQLTFDMAKEFLARHAKRKCRFTPVGVAQGWSPRSYADAVKRLQQMGFERIALGGMVPLKDPEILISLEAIEDVRKPSTELHLFGVKGSRSLKAFGNLGVTSFDSTSPLRQAFKDARNNYYASNRTYSAIRVPQVEGNPKLQAAIRAGKVDQERARELEEACLQALAAFDRDELSVDRVVDCLSTYAELYDAGGKDRTGVYREALVDRPWRDCKCDICNKLGIHVIIFRGAERNRRRGFHNLYVFKKNLAGALRKQQRAARKAESVARAG